MARPYLLSGIDIGNSEIKVVIAKVERDSAKPELIGVGSALSHGLRRGMVVDMEETVANLATAIQRAEAMAGTKLKRAYVAVNGLHIKNQVSRGVIAVSRADNEISQNDIDRVLQAASVVSLPPNREIIHVLPRNFTVDGSEVVKNPLGMKGVRLEAEVSIIDGLSPYLRNIAKCVQENSIEVADLVFAPLAASLSSLDKNQREYGVMHLDFGGGTSSLTVFEEADLLHSAVLPIGSKHITNDLAVALRTSMDVAERVKIEHAATSHELDLRKRENIDLSSVMGEQNFVVPKKQLVRVVDARAGELIEMIAAELKKVPRNGMLPAGIVISGGGANLPGLLSFLKEALRLPVKIARPLHMDGVVDAASDPSYAVATGLVLWAAEQEINTATAKHQAFQGSDESVFTKVLDWLKNFLP
ncbi:MAG: cell division protein FtsA [Candidatus Yanofskybacteria bacterium RIFCSPHIGHO2_02_FULL_50_12]|uniref:Cell division protein FtsA n=1 Tax=Candidatus Yanofskybacteria bacterium RIFCSPHIGHO2_02_FULL_50_12 TaxID=1802685 RepID=A0A1F8FX49_9BACT|nr:MAG: cell division protein FtsA [Candidatus Yanofskybacteria bacterium RIFCSPHIGHO2_02_FULL_50_12]